MKILVISDTHIPITATKLPSIIEKEAKTSDCCLHCGDFITYSTFENLTSLTKTYGVCGNMDDNSIKERLPDKQIIKLGDFRIGLIHGRGHPNTILAYIKREFSDDFNDIDIFVFGHSHQSLNKEIDGKFYFNPGSPTDKMFAPYRSYGILEIIGDELKSKVVKIG